MPRVNTDVRLEAAKRYSSQTETEAREHALRAANHSWIHEPSHDDYGPPRQVRLFEGNYDAWKSAVCEELERCGLSHCVFGFRSTTVGLDEEQDAALESDDTWAANITLWFCDPSFLARHPLERPITASRLYEELGRLSKPFRLLDLPRELRDRIYIWSLLSQRRKGGVSQIAIAAYHSQRYHHTCLIVVVDPWWLCLPQPAKISIWRSIIRS